MERFRISVTLKKQVEFKKRPLKGKFGKMSLKIHFMLLHISLPLSSCISANVGAKGDFILHCILVSMLCVISAKSISPTVE